MRKVGKWYKVLIVDGQTFGSTLNALIEQFNRPNSPIFIFPLRDLFGMVPVASSPFPVAEPVFPSPTHFGGAMLAAAKVFEHDSFEQKMKSDKSESKKDIRSSKVRTSLFIFPRHFSWGFDFEDDLCC
nr:uncharacterized protein LOC125420702 [Ziziphus jujuba var. spinosa]